MVYSYSSESSLSTFREMLGEKLRFSKTISFNVILV